MFVFIGSPLESRLVTASGLCIAMYSAFEELIGTASRKTGRGCLRVLSVAADGRTRTVVVTESLVCQGLWIALAENESKLSITVCEKSALEDGCGSQPTYNFYRNAVLEFVDDKCVLISDPYSLSCFFYFETPEQCQDFHEEVDSLRVDRGLHDDLELERKLVAGNFGMNLREPFADVIEPARRELPLYHEDLIVELDAGLGIVSEAILGWSRAELIAITRPGITQRLERYLSRKNHVAVADTSIETAALKNRRASGIVSRRLTHFLFDSDILKRFLRLRDTKLAERGRLLPSKLTIKAALISRSDLWREKKCKTNFWLTKPFGLPLPDLHSDAQDEEFAVPEIGRVREADIKSDIAQCEFDLASPHVNEESIKNFMSQFEFRVSQDTDIHGIVFWCEARVGDDPSTAVVQPEISIACILKDYWRDVSRNCRVVVGCKFHENRARSYDVSVEYNVPHPLKLNSVITYSMMLAEPHPFGRTVRREVNVRADLRSHLRWEPCPDEREDRESNLAAPSEFPISRGFVY